MTLRQIEIKKLANNIGLITQYNDTDKTLAIKNDETLLCKFDEQGFICKDADIIISSGLEETVEELKDIASQVRLYVELYEKAPQMQLNGIEQYRKLAEFDDVVLGADDKGVHGLLFSTWRVYDDRSGVTLGHYTPYFASAKEEFATRAKLVDECRLFSKEESENLYKCVRQTIVDSGSLTYEQETQLKDLLEKLNLAYPGIEDNPIFESSGSPEPKMVL